MVSVIEWLVKYFYFNFWVQGIILQSPTSQLDSGELTKIVVYSIENNADFHEQIK